VAGVAMGLILGEQEGDEPVILTDILGLEDALGTMDFKVHALRALLPDPSMSQHSLQRHSPWSPSHPRIESTWLLSICVQVAGNETGITTFQLDIKSEGLTVQTLERALSQAQRGRLKILAEMKKALSEPRPLKPTIPKILEIMVRPFWGVSAVLVQVCSHVRGVASLVLRRCLRTRWGRSSAPRARRCRP